MPFKAGKAPKDVASNFKQIVGTMTTKSTKAALTKALGVRCWCI